MKCKNLRFLLVLSLVMVWAKSYGQFDIPRLAVDPADREISSTSLVDIYNHSCPLAVANTDGYIDSLISIGSPSTALVINIKLNPNLTKEEQDFKKLIDEKGSEALYYNIFRIPIFCNIGFLCYQLCIPMEIKLYSEYNPEGFPLKFSWETLREVYDPLPKH